MIIDALYGGSCGCAAPPPSLDHEQLLACARGDVFGPGNARLPSPPMLMFDRITEISAEGGAFGKGLIRGELEVRPDLWFFDCHFDGDPVMPGCLGLDAMWQLAGFFLPWLGEPGRGRALGVGEVRFKGQVLPDARLVTYRIDIRRVMRGRLPLVIADGVTSVDGEEIYSAKSLRVGLFPLEPGAVMKRVVVTGIGITSCLGNDPDTVSESLSESRSGISKIPEYEELGLRSHVAGVPKIDLNAEIDRKLRRFMGDAAAYSYVAMRDAIADAGLDADRVTHERTGLIAGSGGGSPQWQIEVGDLLRGRGVRKVGPFMVPRTMSSTVSASLATAFGIRGPSYSISAACATSAHCIGAAADLIRRGTADIVFAGGGEEVHWGMTAQFDAMGALSASFNATPEAASRPYDAHRDGFVIAGGGGMLVMEEYESARARGAPIYAELLGYGVTSDGADMVTPSGEGAVRCMRMALSTTGRDIDYLNTHGTSTPVGDTVELEAVRAVFGQGCPPISSTKALSGHSLGAASVHEAIYSLLMMRDGFIAGSANIVDLDPRAVGFPIVRESRSASLTTVMSNSFGFGGTNASLVFGRI